VGAGATASRADDGSVAVTAGNADGGVTSGDLRLGEVIASPT